MGIYLNELRPRSRKVPRGVTAGIMAGDATKSAFPYNPGYLLADEGLSQLCASPYSAHP